MNIKRFQNIILHTILWIFAAASTGNFQDGTEESDRGWRSEYQWRLQRLHSLPRYNSHQRPHSHPGQRYNLATSRYGLSREQEQEQPRISDLTSSLTDQPSSKTVEDLPTYSEMAKKAGVRTSPKASTSNSTSQPSNSPQTSQPSQPSQNPALTASSTPATPAQTAKNGNSFYSFLKR